MFGNVLNLRHLAHLIGRERRFYGLQARGLYGDHTPHETFEAMAADYIAEMRTVEPHGPYWLGGFSGGGITAFEIARQLMSQGESVSMLVLLDTPLPSSPALTARDRWMLHLQRFRQRGAAHLVDWMRERYEWRMKDQGHQPAIAKKPFDFHSEAIEAAFRRALSRYQLVRLPLDVKLFRPKLDRTRGARQGARHQPRSTVRLSRQRLGPLRRPCRGLRNAGRPRQHGAGAQRAGARGPSARVHGGSRVPKNGRVAWSSQQRTVIAAAVRGVERAGSPDAGVADVVA